MHAESVNHSKKISNKIRRNSKIVDVIIMTILTIMALAALLPFYNVILLSFAKGESIAQHPLYLLPYSFDLTAYKCVLQETKFYRSFLVTIFVTLMGSALNMLLSTTGAYALSKKRIPGRNFILAAILFTMFFGGGLIPHYLVIKSLGLINSIFAMILPAGINTMYLIIMKNYFNTLPESLEESAKIDGANDLTILIKIIIPISKPFIATFALFYAVERWNEWWNALLFINESKKYPLQIYLREMLVNMIVQNTAAQALVDQKNIAQSIQMATIVITAIPIICVYPFLQKHFAKGIMIGSIKE